MQRSLTALVILSIAIGSSNVFAQVTFPNVPKGESRQVLDTAFVAVRRGPAAYSPGTGPLVLIDEAHHNFHTAGGRYRPFARLLESDGFRVAPNTRQLAGPVLANARVLVVANALNQRNESQGDWRLPALSAFDDSEIAATVAWVRIGGALLIIADHMPFAGAATKLAAAFGIHFFNGYALWGDADPRTGDYPITFRRSDGTLRANSIVDGHEPAARVDSIESFTGSAFWIDSPAAVPIMRLPAKTRIMMPIVAWQFYDSSATVAGGGLQGGALTFGRGRVAVFGEAAMFTAQRKGEESVPMGMNAPAASQNAQFVLNVVHWLVRSK